MAVDSSFVILPRFTTLVGATTFSTLPLDCSGYGGAQFQVWRGAFRAAGGTPTFTMYLEESLDTEDWVLGPDAAGPHEIGTDRKFFSYDFRLRWFRLRIVLTGVEPIVTCWAEGLLRGGGGGMWTEWTPPMTSVSAVGARGEVRVRQMAGWDTYEGRWQDPRGDDADRYPNPRKY